MGRRLETVTLDRDRLSHPHQKLVSETGETFGLSLPHGESLEAGSVLFADDKRIVVVELAPEDALVIRPRGQMEWARAAYNTGNMHQMAFLQEDCIITPYDPILESVMQRLGVACKRQVCPIDGIRASVSQDQHSHSHSHGGEHGHSNSHVHSHEHGYGEHAPGGGHE
ncbi:MAG: hypothetical protein IJ128_07115 [Firmicutes bacterium]|nr:hypothetical protein [Bacillota bacterium]